MPAPTRPAHRTVPAACLLALGVACTPRAAIAETWTLDALEDFPSIDAGDVPYYRDVGNDALAIDASVVAYRDRIARATAPHPGPGGTFDLTLTTLAEVDGETTYRVLVDGARVGTATNARVPDEFAEATLAFDGVEIPDGATLAIESSAVSNGLVPEDDAFAFARGRWRELAITASLPDGADPETVGLAVSLTGSGNAVRVGDTATLVVGVGNASATTVATSPVVTVTLPAGLAFASGDGCRPADEDILCELVEIGPGGTATASLELDAAAPGTATVLATVASDQVDATAEDDRTALDIEVLPLAPAPTGTPVAPPVVPEPVAPVTPAVPVAPAAVIDPFASGGDGPDGPGESVPEVGTTPDADGGSGGGAVWLVPLLASAARIGRGARAVPAARRSR